SLGGLVRLHNPDPGLLPVWIRDPPRRRHHGRLRAPGRTAHPGGRMSRDSGRYDAVVLGATPEGLAAALELAAARRRVLVLEAGPRPGGPWADLEFHPGFRADAAFEDA